MINPTIQVVVGPITPIFTASVEDVRESLSPRQTILTQGNVTDAARSCARTYRTPGKISGTERDDATPRDTYSSETNSRLSLQSSSFLVTAVYPAQFRDQYIVNPSPPGSIVKRDRSAEPFDARINVSPSKNSDYTRFFNHVVGLESVSGEVAKVNASKRMNFASNPVLGETKKFVDLWLSTVNIADKLNYVFCPITRAEGLTDHTYWYRR